MRSQSPLIIKHFVPLQFSKDVMDFNNLRNRSYVQPEQNPLQNIKLRTGKNQNDINFTLIFKNKSNKQFTSKFKVKTNRLVKQMEEQSKKTSIIKNHILHEQLKLVKRDKPSSMSRPSTFSGVKPQTARSVAKEQQTRYRRQKYKEVIPRKIFSSRSFRKFTTIQTAKPYNNHSESNDFFANNQQLEDQLKIRGHRNNHNFF